MPVDESPFAKRHDRCFTGGLFIFRIIIPVSRLHHSGQNEYPVFRGQDYLSALCSLIGLSCIRYARFIRRFAS